MAVVAELHVSFVCTGNICRSPMAEKMFAGHLYRAGLADQVRVSSAGTTAWHVGDDADPRTTTTLRKHGYPTGHVAAVFGDEHRDADLLIALDTGHERELARLGVPTDRRRLLRSFDPGADGPDVPDPYYGSTADFELVREQIEAAIPGLLDWVRTTLNTRAAAEPTPLRYAAQTATDKRS
ncbi:low molecular weight protein-tyrosine-phosphatase [Nocardia sp. NPDC051463]|uniref:low molecular weight protein-tyrosine-phosphatase n=1 Tax=Nocardia sp. NPDC051463 TaxID=3154845 RepID=UPI00344C334B